MKKYDISDIVEWTQYNDKGTPPAELLIPLYKFKKRNLGIRGYGYVALASKIGITKGRIEFWMRSAEALLEGKPKKRNISTTDRIFMGRRWNKKIQTAELMMLERRNKVREIQQYNIENDINPQDAFTIALDLMYERSKNARMSYVPKKHKPKSYGYEVDGEPELDFLGGRRL
jgi:hypothetical protein